MTKIIQVFDCKVARHGNMIVGRTGSGKSAAWRCLERALARLKREEPEDDRYQKVSRDHSVFEGFQDLCAVFCCQAVSNGDS